MSRQRHPDAEALASFRAGLAGGFRGRRLARHVTGCTRCASVTDQLAEVSSALAAVPAPPLPEAFERQISAAIAAEAAARAGAASTAAVRPPVLTAAGVTAGVTTGSASRDSAAHGRAGQRSQPAARHRPHGPRFRLAMALAPVLACLLAGFGYLASQTGASSGPAGTSTAAAAPMAGAAPSPVELSPGPNVISPLNGRHSFLVAASGTNYRQATLREQVNAELAARGHGAGSTATAPGGPPVPSASPAFGAGQATSGGTPSAEPAAESAGGSVPSQALVDCVLHLTGGVTPSLVDRATYQGEPAYVIAVPGRAWVVGLGCTASKPELITSVSLVPLP